MSSFEEAKHQGYSKADMAADMAEYAARMTANKSLDFICRISQLFIKPYLVDSINCRLIKIPISFFT